MKESVILGLCICGGNPVMHRESVNGKILKWFSCDKCFKETKESTCLNCAKESWNNHEFRETH